MIDLDFFGSDTKFHHIGLATKSIETLSPSSEVIFDPIQKVSVAFVRLNGVDLELIEPSGDDSPVTKSLESGVKLLHICYEVNDIRNAIQKCRSHGFHCIAQPVPATAFDDREIAWVYSRAYGLVELLARSGEKKDG